MHAPAGEIDRHYRIWVNDDGHFALEYDDVGPLAIVTTQLLNEHIESDLHHWLATYTRGYLFVHAGCVSWRNRGIVIPGRSYAGKTTLTRALVEAEHLAQLRARRVPDTPHDLGRRVLPNYRLTPPVSMVGQEIDRAIREPIDLSLIHI